MIARRLSALLLVTAVSCGDDPPPPPPSKGAPSNAAAGGGPAATPAAGAAPAAPPGLAAPPSPGREKLLADIRKRPFKPEEMTANPPTNSDPFHSNLDKFVSAPPPPDPRFLTNLLPKYSLEELKLTAIILGSGDGTAARAMLVDPTGVGHTIKRGDRVSKSGALVQRILSDRIVYEFSEDIGQGKKRTVVRAVELHPTEGQGEQQRGPMGGPAGGGGGAPPGGAGGPPSNAPGPPK